MPFFMNPFEGEFRGHWILNDQTYILTFVVKPNQNRSECMVAFNAEPYDFSLFDELTINYAYDREFKNYSSLTINVAGAVPGATTANEVIATLNSNAIFADNFVASQYFFSHTKTSSTPCSVLIKSTRQKTAIKAFISNTSAESIMRFNKKAGVNELPTYFERHTVDNRFNFEDSLAQLLLLDEADPIDAAIIEEAGFDPLMPLDDWELLRGRAGQFIFRKLTVDGNDRPTRIIEYHAGAMVGDLARQIDYIYTGVNRTPDQVTEIPHTLVSADLVTPP